MSEECTHNCETCSANCKERKNSQDFIEKPHEMSHIKNVIGVVSGKGGVGKSLVTSLLAVSMQRLGYKTAILDADITGPSIPKIFQLNKKADVSEVGIFPVKTKTDINVMSLNLLLNNDTDPVVWRGPVIAGTVKQFWTDVVWGDVDYMFVDMPPGTGDVPLTVFQSIPIKGVVIVTSPQNLVSMIVKKAVAMAKLMNIPILGIVENMSYYECPECGDKQYIFGKSDIEKTAEEYDIPSISKIPVNPKLAAACDAGAIELFEGDWLDNLAAELENLNK